MSDQKKIPDDFWDLSSLTPKSKPFAAHTKSVDTVSVALEASKSGEASPYTREDTVIHRVIAPERPTAEENAFSSIEQYAPSESLIHTVTLKKWKCSYRFYDEFLQDALRYRDTVGEEAPYVSFFSYVPQYNQLNGQQMAFYLWWRENCRRGSFIKTDYSYLLLYVFELINLGTHADVTASQHMLTDLWKNYREAFPMLIGKLSRWICDFSLIHRLPPPENADAALVRNEAVLKEFYIAMPSDDMRACARSLIKYCSSYDYRTSKFATGENLAVFHEHMLGALVYALRNFHGEAGLLRDFSGGDSRMSRNAFEGALCCADQKYLIELEYCSFSKTNELRYLIGDVLKYAENKIRAYLGIKSRLSVYSVTQELRAVLDEYFALYLKPHKPVQRKEEKHDYDMLYDLPKKPFSLEDARRIEEASWETTNDLIAAFEDESDPTLAPVPPPTPQLTPEPPMQECAPESDLCVALGALLPFARAVLEGDLTRQAHEAKQLEKMPEWLVDEINRISADTMGDILIEDDGNTYTVVEDYRDML